MAIKPVRTVFAVVKDCRIKHIKGRRCISIRLVELNHIVVVPTRITIANVRLRGNILYGLHGRYEIADGSAKALKVSKQV